MKIGNLDIKKAFLGSLPLNSKNAYIGNYKIIDGDEPEPVILDYLWIQPLEASSIDMNVETGLAKTMQNMEYSFDKKSWSKFADIPGEGEFTSLADMQTANPTTIYCLISQQIKSVMDERGYGVNCYHWGDSGNPVDWPGEPARYEGKTVDGRYCYSYNIEATPVNVIFCITENRNSRYLTSNIMGWQQNTYYNWENTGGLGSSQPIGSEAVGTYTWETIGVPANTKVYLRNTESWQYGKQTKVVTSLQSVNYNIGGDIETIQDYQNITTEITVSSKYLYMFQNDIHIINAGELKLNYDTLYSSCYNGMFQYCSNLTTAPELPATTLASSCYYNMFKGCTSLTTAPELPATTLASYCYSDMFLNCTSLTTAPELPATTLDNYCYQYMFYGCTNLTTAPELPATTLANNCYGYMFLNCTSLTTAPALPATTLASYCYQYMFYNCASLTQAPELPATTLTDYCYYGMFVNCSSLTTAPALPATTLTTYCYNSMFSGCSSLTTAPALPATTLAANCYRNMFYGCSSLTTAPALPATTLATQCYYSMFSMCNNLTTAPALPATTLTTYCYNSMFSGCSKLTTAPELPATTLVNLCYATMFYGCSSLVEVTTRATSWNTSYASSWLSGVASTGTLYNLGKASIPTGNTSGCPSGWTIKTTK